MSGLRILVTGSRNWTDRDVVWQALVDAIRELTPPGATPTTHPFSSMTLIHGAARGLDTLAAEQAEVRVPAWFGSCRTCGRLIAVGGLNQDGRCTKDCGGYVLPQRVPPGPCPEGKCLREVCIGRRWCGPAGERLMEAIGTAHSCPEGGPCAFGNIGCVSGLRSTLDRV